MRAIIEEALEAVKNNAKSVEDVDEIVDATFDDLCVAKPETIDGIDSLRSILPALADFFFDALEIREELEG